MQIREMRNADVGPVSAVVATAYSDVLLRLFGRKAMQRYRARTPAELESCRLMFPHGCLVAAEGRSLVGAVFARKWGSLGWFSSLAVLPDRQGRGTGKALAQAATKILLESGCVTVGLETWLNSAAYTAMYMGMGFRPLALTAQMTTPINRDWGVPNGTQAVLRADLPGRLETDADEAAERICNKLVPGMSLAVELEAARKSESKKSLWLIKDGEIVGVALVDTSPEFDGTGTHNDMWLAALDPDSASPEDFLALAAGAAVEGRRAGRTHLNLDVSTDYPETYRFLLDAGFRASNQLMRFVNDTSALNGSGKKLVFNLGRWAT